MNSTNFYTLPAILLGLFLSCSLRAQVSTVTLKSIPLTTSFLPEDYQGGIQNWDIAQDERGYLYVANNFGLLEFDGHHWQNHPVSNSTRVRSVLVHRRRVYTGGQGQFGYFEPDTTGSLRFVSLKDSLSEKDQNFDDVWKIHHYRDQIVFSTHTHLFFYQEDTHTLEVLRVNQPLGFTFAWEQELLTYSAEQGLLMLKDQQLEPYPSGDYYRGKMVMGMIREDPQHYLVVTLEGEVSRITPEGVTVLEACTQLLRGVTVNAVSELTNGTLAIGTQNQGVYLLSRDGTLVQQLTQEAGLNSLTVASLHEDQFNNLWVGLNNGISYVELNSPFSLINEKTGLPGSGYTAKAYQNAVYLGTNNGLYYTRSQPYDAYHPVKNSDGQVYALSEVDQDLVLNHHRGAFRIVGDQALPFFEQEGTWSMKKVPGQALYLCGGYDGFYFFRKRNGQFELVQKMQGFSESSRVFEFDAHRTLWMSHGYKGVYRLGVTQDLMSPPISFFGAQDGFPSNILINVYKIDDELVFPAQHGVYAYDTTAQSFRPHEVFDPLLADYGHVSKMVQDALGNVYFIADNQLGLLRKNTLGGYTLETNVFHRINKLLSDDLENINIIDLEHILIGAREGFVVFNPLTDVHKPEDYLTYLKQVVLTGTDSLVYGGQLSRPPDSARFGPNEHSVRFQFASPYFDGMEDIQYSYRLRGFDERWSAFGAASAKEYTNLGSGRYTFEVKARNIYGQLSQPARYTFTILAPWYATRTAYGVYTLLVLGVLGVWYQRLRKKHEREKVQLEQEKLRALLEKESEFTRVQQRSTRQIMELEHDKLESEIAHKNKRLAGVTMHLITKNEFIIDMKKELKQAIHQKKNLKEEVSRVIKSIDRNVTLEDDWEEFAQHFDQVHGDFIKRLKAEYPHLTHQDTKLSSFLRMGMSTKEIASLLHNTVRGVEISRYRLRKKLDLDRGTNLVEFMVNF